MPLAKKAAVPAATALYEYSDNGSSILKSTGKNPSTTDATSRPGWVRNFDIRRGAIQIENANIHPEHDVKGRSLPYVTEFDENSRLFANREAFDSRSFHVEVGAQLALGGLLCSVNEIASSHPEKDSCDCEDNREGRKNLIVAAMDETTQTRAIGIEPDSERGAVFLKLGIGGLLLLLLYAGLKRR